MTELALRPRQRVAFPAGEAGARALIYVLEGYARLIGPAGEHNLDAEEAIIATADVGLTIANRGDTVARVLHLAAPPPDWTDRASEDEEAPTHDEVVVPENDEGPHDEDELIEAVPSGEASGSD